MGAWGSGNFEQDHALDFVWKKVQQPLLRQIKKMIAKPVYAEADEPDSGPIMAAVEILAILTEHTGAVPPKLEEVALWKKTFLGAWDSTSGDVIFRQEDVIQRRRVIVATFDRLARLAAKWHKKDG
jgi:hypothetical protein